MIVKRAFTGKCRACGNYFDFYEYEGLEGSRYSNHFCKESRDFWLTHPRARTLVFERTIKEKNG